MTKFASAYLTTAVVFFALDFIWLSTMSAGFYRTQIGTLLLARPNLAIAGLFYLGYVAGLVALVVLPALNGGSFWPALFGGLILGLIAYGTYDLTNLSTLKGWSWTVSVVDMAWGGCVTATAATGGYFATSWLTKWLGS